MLLHGDEMGRTQHGNNNAYCQDNELSWFDWDSSADDADLLDVHRRLIALRREHPVFRRRRFFTGSRRGGRATCDDIAWLTPGGEEMTDEDWENGFARSLAVFLNGDGHHRARPARPADRRRLVPAAVQRARRRDRPSRSPRRMGRDGPPRSTRPRTADTASPRPADVPAGEGVASVEGYVQRCWCAAWREPGRSPTATYRLQLTARLRLRPRGAHRRRTCRSRGQPRLPVADAAGRRPARRTATTSWTTGVSARARRRGRPSTGWPRRCARRARPRPRRRAQPRGEPDAETATRSCGRCCGTAPARAYARWFDVDWDGATGRS